MKRLPLILVAMISLSAARAQVYDLIVTDKGDSIACRIDRIEDPAIYFEMRYNNRWITTSVPLEEVITYEYGAVARRDIVFREGTSYIAYRISPQDRSTSVYGIQKNSVYLEYELLTISLSYERMFPVGRRTGLVLAGGISPGSR